MIVRNATGAVYACPCQRRIRDKPHNRGRTGGPVNVRSGLAGRRGETRLPLVSTEPLAIAHVSPFALEANNDVGTQVRRVSEELARRGHRVLIIAPSQSTALVRDSRRVLHDDPGGLLERADGAPVQVAVGGVLPFSPTRRRADSIPVDVARTIEEALVTMPLDVVHVHEPFAPSASSVALRHSRSLNVATFHGPTERSSRPRSRGR